MKEHASSFWGTLIFLVSLTVFLILLNKYQWGLNGHPDVFQKSALHKAG